MRKPLFYLFKISLARYIFYIETFSCFWCVFCMCRWWFNTNPFLLSCVCCGYWFYPQGVLFFSPLQSERFLSTLSSFRLSFRSDPGLNPQTRYSQWLNFKNTLLALALCTLPDDSVSCAFRSAHGVQSVRSPAGQHNLPQQVANWRWANRIPPLHAVWAISEYYYYIIFKDLQTLWSMLEGLWTAALHV